MSDRTTARSTERFLGALGAGASSENWMAGGSFRDVLMELHKEGHISDVQYVTACRLVQDMQRAHGSSAGIVSQTQERVQTSLRSRTAPPGGGDPDAFARMDRLLSQLRGHERDVLAFLILKRELPRGSLSDLGRLLSRYQTNKTTRAAAVGRIGALLDSVVELYG
jgi:hypothetical protein